MDGDTAQDVIIGASDVSSVIWFRNERLASSPHLGPAYTLSFSTGAVLSSGIGPGDLEVMDLNGDGMMDILVSVSVSGKLSAFYANAPGGLDFTKVDLLSFPGAQNAEVAHLDGDGFPDVVAIQASNPGDLVLLLSDGLGGFNTPVVLDSFGSKKQRAISLGDLDGDGDLDIFVGVRDTDAHLIYTNNGAGSFPIGSPQTLSAGVNGPVGSVIHDLDGDGLGEIALGMYNDGWGVALLSRSTAPGPFSQTTLTPPVRETDALVLGDLDRDSFIDVVTAANSDRHILVSRGQDHHAFGPMLSIASMTQDTIALGLGSLGAPGPVPPILDVIAVTSSKIFVIPNTSPGPGNLSFGSLTEVMTGNGNTRDLWVGDLDGDGMDDALLACDHANTLFWIPSIVSGTRVILSTGHAASAVVAVDLDGPLDGNTELDVVIVDPDAGTLLVFSHNASLPSHFNPTPKTISNALSGADSLVAAHFDNDLYPDLAVASSTANKVAWFASASPFSLPAAFPGPEHVLTSSMTQPRALAVFDANGDGVSDLAIASEHSIYVSLNSNTGVGSPGLSPPLLLSVTTSGINHNIRALAGSVTGDLFYGTLVGSAWIPNTPAFAVPGASPQPLRISNVQGKHNPASRGADLDGDGDVDIVVAIVTDLELVLWYENVDYGSSWVEHLVTSEADSPQDLMVADADGDGDLDVFVVSVDDTELSWIENKDGAGTFGLGAQHIIASDVAGVTSFQVLDADHDQDVDVLLVASGQVRLFLSTRLAPSPSSSSSSDALWDTEFVQTYVTGFAPPALPTLAIVSYDHAATTPLLATIGILIIDDTGNVWSLPLPLPIPATAPAPPSLVATLLGTVSTTGAQSYTMGNFVDDDGRGADIILYSPSSPTSTHPFTLLSNTTAAIATNGSTPLHTKTLDPLDDANVDVVFMSSGDCSDDGLDDLVLVLKPSTVGIAFNLDGRGTFAQPSFVGRSTGLADVMVHAFLIDISGDTVLDIVYTSYKYGVFWKQVVTHSLFSSFSQPMGQSVDAVLSPHASSLYSQPGCVVPSSLLCLWDSIRNAVRPCGRRSIGLPPAKFSSCPLRGHFEVSSSLHLRSTSASASPIIDCAVPFSSIGAPLFRVRASGVLILQSIELTNLGVGRSSLYGSPGLRVDGPGSVLVLDSVVVSHAHAASDVPGALVYNEGVGGAVLATDGGALGVFDTVFDSSSAATHGGAVALLPGSGGVFHNTTFAHCVADAFGGGALYLDTFATAIVSDGSVFAGNRALSGPGGALLVRPGASLVLSNGSVVGNTAVFGGGVALLPAYLDTVLAAAASVAETPQWSEDPDSVWNDERTLAIQLDNVDVTGNVASKYGGGVYLCGDWLGLAGTTLFDANVAGSGSEGTSYDGFVCPVENADHTRYPWMNGTGVEDLDIHSKLAMFVWEEEPAESVAVGGVLTGSFSSRDVLGHQATYLDALAVLAFDGDDNGLVETSDVVLEVKGVTTGLGGSGESGGIVATNTDAVGLVLGYRVDLVGAHEGFTPLTGSVVLDPCGIGEGWTEISPGRFICLPCGASAYSEEVSAEPCRAIVGCGANAVDISDPSASNRTRLPSCVCDAGFFFTGMRDGLGREECNPCPNGALCFRGLDPPLTAPGYFQTGNTTFLKCLRPGACPGLGVVCAEGHSGFLCSTCVSGYYSNSAARCVKCPSQVTAIFALVSVILAVLAIGAGVAISVGLARFHSRVKGIEISSSADYLPMAILRRRTIPASVSLCAVSFQVIGIMSTLDFEWSKAAQDLLLLFNLANIDINLFASECTLSTFHVKYALSVLIPAGVLLLVATVSLSAKGYAHCTRRSSSVTPGSGASVASVLGYLVEVSVPTLMDAVLFSLTPILYIPMSRAVLVLFDCVRLPNGDIVLDVNPGVACFDSAWFQVAPFGVAGLLLYIVAIPAYMFTSLYKRRDMLLHVDTYARYGAAYALYRVPFYWTGVVDLVAKRLAIVIAAVMLSGTRIYQITVVSFILAAGVYLLVRYQPYFHGLYNRLDTRLHMLLVAIAVVGLAFYAADARSGQDGQAEDTTIPFVALIVVLCILVCVALHGIGMDVWGILKRRKSMATVGAMGGGGRGGLVARYLELQIPDLDPQEASAAVALVRLLDSGQGMAWSGGGGDGKDQGGGGAVEMIDASFCSVDSTTSSSRSSSSISGSEVDEVVVVRVRGKEVGAGGREGAGLGGREGRVSSPELVESSGGGGGGGGGGNVGWPLKRSQTMGVRKMKEGARMGRNGRTLQRSPLGSKRTSPVGHASPMGGSSVEESPVGRGSKNRRSKKARKRTVSNNVSPVRARGGGVGGGVGGGGGGGGVGGGVGVGKRKGKRLAKSTVLGSKTTYVRRSISMGRDSLSSTLPVGFERNEEEEDEDDDS